MYVIIYYYIKSWNKSCDAGQIHDELSLINEKQVWRFQRGNQKS
jgi:hypothetical protein